MRMRMGDEGERASAQSASLLPPTPISPSGRKERRSGEPSLPPPPPPSPKQGTGLMRINVSTALLRAHTLTVLRYLVRAEYNTNNKKRTIFVCRGLLLISQLCTVHAPRKETSSKKCLLLFALRRFFSMHPSTFEFLSTCPRLLFAPLYPLPPALLVFALCLDRKFGPRGHFPFFFSPGRLCRRLRTRFGRITTTSSSNTVAASSE